MYISQHKYFKARQDSYTTEDGKLVDPYFVVELPTSACAMAITENNEVILVRQYRHPIQQKILELPGGFIEDGEDASVGIERELLEETGYVFNKIVPLGQTAANPGVLNNYTELFLATGGVKQAEQSLDHNEEIEIILVPLIEARQLLYDGKITQAMHALCLFYGFKRLDEIT